MDEAEIRDAIAGYKFYHTIKLTDDISTPGVELYRPAQNLCLKYLRALDFKGKRVLDIGCADGLYSFEAEALGAEEVVSIDSFLSKPAVEFLIPFFDSKIKMMEMSLFDVRPDDMGRFDIVILAGVLYHLRYPFWGLKVIRDVLKEGGHLIIETAIWNGERNNAMLFCPNGEESPYTANSCTFFNVKGLVGTLESLGFAVRSVELLKRNPMHGIKHDVKRIGTRLISQILMSISPESRPAIRQVTRGVFHATLSDYDKDDPLTRYWDGFHNLRSAG